MKVPVSFPDVQISFLGNTLALASLHSTSGEACAFSDLQV